jgi:hypothetical protein
MSRKEQLSCFICRKPLFVGNRPATARDVPKDAKASDVVCRWCNIRQTIIGPYLEAQAKL